MAGLVELNPHRADAKDDLVVAETAFAAPTLGLGIGKLFLPKRCNERNKETDSFFVLQVLVVFPSVESVE